MTLVTAKAQVSHWAYRTGPAPKKQVHQEAMSYKKRGFARAAHIVVWVLACLLLLTLLTVLIVLLTRTRKRYVDLTGTNGNFDHRAHAVAGHAYTAIDFSKSGSATVQLDGTRSHSHYFNPGPPVITGKIEEFSWFVNETSEEFATGPSPSIKFFQGVTNIGLKVTDNSDTSHVDYTTVTVLNSVTEGIYCYYYRLPEDDAYSLESLPIAPTLAEEQSSNAFLRPVYAEHYKSGFSFAKPSDFAPSVSQSSFALRCVFRLPQSADASRSVFSYSGGFATFSVDGEATTKGPASSGDISVIVDTSQEPRNAELVFVSTLEMRSETSFPLSLTAQGLGRVSTDLADVVPVIVAVEPQSSTLVGGGRVRLVGRGLWNGVQVFLDEKPLDAAVSNIDMNSITVTAPKSDTERVAYFMVRNNAGSSNQAPFEYSSTGLPPLNFEQSLLEPAENDVALPGLLTGIAYGPDHRFYASSLDGHVYSFALSKDMKVSDVCKSESLGANRSVLALAFNPAAQETRIYAASSILEWKAKGKLPGENGWKNGKIQSLVPSGGSECLRLEKDVITGLPVSNHDHGINGMVFDQFAQLHIQVGGFTNAGHNTAGNKLGGLDENPLSAASVVANVTAPGFDGQIMYDSNDPATAQQIRGDVRVFSPGYRNSFGICWHSRDVLLATDNGASLGFGDLSTSCDTSSPLEQHMPDKLIRVAEGKYAGHPNRNRGRTDPRQCTFVPASAESSNDYELPIATFESSTNGVIEYTANILGGQLKGNVLASKYSTNVSPGRIYRVQLEGENDSLRGSLDSLWEASGLTIAMTPWGDIISPRVYKPEILAIRPVYELPDTPVFISVLPFRGPAQGGNTVLVTGHAFGNAPTAYFGVSPCTEVLNVAEDGSSFLCVVPPGGKGEGVQVQVRTAEGYIAESAGGIDYMYMSV